MGVLLLGWVESGTWELYIGPRLLIEEAVKFHARDIDAPLGVFFYSTLFTSVWALMFVLAGVVFRVISRSARILSGRFNIREKPFSSLGFVGVLVVTAIYVFACPFVLF